MDRRRKSIEESSLFNFTLPRETKKKGKSPYQNHVENSVKKLVAKEDKPYTKPSNVKINDGGSKYTFNDVTEPIDLPITDKTNLRFKIVKSEEEGIYRVDIRTMALKNNQWTYTQRGVNFELGYIEDVIMNLVSLTEEIGMETNI
jgi:hypothetical protein